MKRRVITTGDGSKTIQIEDWNEQYHSKHGAIAEAKHVFIKSALYHYIQDNSETKDISILEMGFGTGLNAMLTKIEAERLQLKINYVGIEAFPISSDEVGAMNYSQLLDIDEDDFLGLHKIDWEKSSPISDAFTLTKINSKFQEVAFKNRFDLIYFDAFGPRVQPELWTETIFISMHRALKKNGVLTTYSSNGNARRAMLAAGFDVEKIPGPPGKREMLRAMKPS